MGLNRGFDMVLNEETNTGKTKSINKGLYIGVNSGLNMGINRGLDWGLYMDIDNIYIFFVTILFYIFFCNHFVLQFKVFPTI